MRYLLDALYLLMFPLAMGLRRSRKRRLGLWDRFLGRTHSAFRNPHSVFPRIWFHGVSVGEIHLLRGIVHEFRARHPRWQCVISSTTDSGLAEARKWFPDLAVIRWPLDFSWAVERALAEVRPGLVVLVESEFWPNFLLTAKRRCIPVMAVNVRLSPRSFRRYRYFRSLTGRWLRLLSHFAVQTPEYAEQLRQLGVPPERVTVTGSVKYDGVMMDRDNLTTAGFRELFNLEPAGLEDSPRGLVWVAGSTQAPEEEIVLAIYAKLRTEFAGLRLILVPRQPDRFEEVAGLRRKHEFGFKRRTELSEPGAQARATAHALACAAGSRHPVILVDTLGELSAIWGLADIAFVGGSLDGHRGGQNMIEPAAYGAAVIFGPHVWNFRDAVDRLLATTAAIQVWDGEELEAVVRRLLANVKERRQLGEAARRLVLEQQGATVRTMNALEIVIAACGLAVAPAKPQAA